MDYVVIYSSKTGNTKMLAEQIRAVSPEHCTYCGPVDECPKSLDCDLYFVGYWTDKGTCPDEIAAYLKKLHKKQVVLFGTAGFSADKTYYQQITQRVSQNLCTDNHILATYMCQGKMPQTVKLRYELMLQTNPHDLRTQMSLRNFETALSHPDATDLKQLFDLSAKILTTSH